MRVPVPVWQPCELLYTCCLLCVQVLLGETAEFRAEFGGRPTPRATWLVGCTEIQQTDKYRIEIAESFSRLSVAATTHDDAAATYTCQLTSAAGEASASARFILQGEGKEVIYSMLERA